MSQAIPLKYYYLYLLVQKLAVAKSTYSLSDDANVIQVLLSLAMQNARNEEERTRWRQLLREIAEITLQLKLVEEEIMEVEEEIRHGNMLEVPPSILAKYSELVTRLREIESLVVSRLDELMGGGLPVQLAVPTGLQLEEKGKRRKRREVVEDDLEDYLP